jgi:hypothetical protein
MLLLLFNLEGLILDGLYLPLTPPV